MSTTDRDAALPADIHEFLTVRGQASLYGIEQWLPLGTKTTQIYRAVIELIADGLVTAHRTDRGSIIYRKAQS